MRPLKLFQTHRTPKRDSLTGLFSAWERTKGQSGPFWLEPKLQPGFRPERATPWLASLPVDAVFLLLDLRGLQQLNHERGYAFVDRQLKSIGARIRAASEPWPAYRTGGDQFLVAARLRNDAEVRALADSVRGAICAALEDGVVLDTWAAAGWAEAGEAPDVLYTALTQQVFAAKRLGTTDLVILARDAERVSAPGV